MPSSWSGTTVAAEHGGTVTDDLRVRSHLLAQRVTADVQEVFGAHLRAVMVKGSLVQHGGVDFIPYFSDVDCHLYLASAAMRSAVTPGLEFALQTEERVDGLDAADYGAGSYSLAFWNEDRLREHALQPLAGQYDIVAGSLPSTFRDGQPEDYLAMSAEVVRNVGDTADRAVRYFADGSDRRLQVRQLATWVKPALAAAATLLTGDPLRGWAAPLSQVLDTVEPAALPSATASTFYQTLKSSWAMPPQPAQERRLLQLGVTTLDEIHRHFTARPEDPSP
jgi:hypothetical protein